MKYLGKMSGKEFNFKVRLCIKCGIATKKKDKLLRIKLLSYLLEFFFASTLSNLHFKTETSFNTYQEIVFALLKERRVLKKIFEDESFILKIISCYFFLDWSWFA